MSKELTPLEACRIIKEHDFPVMIATIPPIPSTMNGKTEKELWEIIETALKRLIELEKSLRKNATREKAKMLDKYIKRFFIPEKCWRDVHYVIESNEKWASMYRDLLKDAPQSNGTKYPSCEKDKED